MNNHHIIEYGNHGPTLVFLHYFGGSAQSWQWVARNLSEHFRCIAFNIPGFGNTKPLKQPTIESLAKFIQDKLATHHVEKYTLIGHSMGAKIALQMAIDDSQKTHQMIEQLLLVAPSPPTVEAMPAREKARMLNHPDRREAEKTVASATHTKLSAQQHTLAVETQLIIDPVTWQWWLLEGMSHSIAHHARRLKLPISVLASRDDPVITPDVIQQEVLCVLPVQNLVWTTDVGHLIPLEASEWLADHIRHEIENRQAPADEKPGIHYWHVWTDDDGISHQARVAIDQFEQESMGPDTAPQWNKHLSAAPAKILFTELPVGWKGTWHENPEPQWIIPLSGRWFVETTDGQRTEMGPGDLSFGGDQNTRTNPDGHKGHFSGTVGNQPARLMLIQLEPQWNAAKPGAFSHSFNSQKQS